MPGVQTVIRTAMNLPGDDAAFFTILVSKKASELSIKSSSIDISHGNNVTSCEELAFVKDSIRCDSPATKTRLAI
jgi:hypothetical protein